VPQLVRRKNSLPSYGAETPLSERTEGGKGAGCQRRILQPGRPRGGRVLPCRGGKKIFVEKERGGPE